MLLHIPDILSADQVAGFRRRLDDADWTDGRETVGHLGAQAKHNQQLPEASPLRRELGEIILVALARHPLFFSAALPLKYLPPRFNRYSGGGAYGYHVDGAVMNLANGEQLRSDISCTLFLSAPEEYEGGELIISDTYGEHEVKLLPATWSCIRPAACTRCGGYQGRTRGFFLLGAEHDPRRRAAPPVVGNGWLDRAPAADRRRRRGDPAADRRVPQPLRRWSEV